MHCVVIGAGIVGTTTALALARRGFEVDVVDSENGVAQGASHANAGLISPGHCFSWAEPGILPVMLRSAMGQDAGLGVCQPWSPRLWRWALMFASQSTLKRWQHNSKAAMDLAGYSRQQLFAQPEIAMGRYGGRDNGIVYLYAPNQKARTHELSLLDDAGMRHELLDPAALLHLDPMLSGLGSIFGSAVYCPGDATGDAAKFCIAASIEAQRLGARFHFDEALKSITYSSNRISSVTTTRRKLATDAVVICAGVASGSLLKTLGHSLPIYPVSGYSITYHVEAKDAPRIGAVSVPHKIAWAHLGEQSLRFTGFADVGVPSENRARARITALQQFALQVCPAVAGLAATEWIGQRPMTPDGLPIIGRGHQANLWLNCGHGAMGWTNACGSAQLMTDMIEGHPTAIDTEPYALHRFD